MKLSKITAAVLALSAFSAQADIIKCHFTEPFYTTTYSMVQQSLSIKNDAENKTQVIKNVSFQIMGAGKFELRTKKGVVIQEITLDNQGSDGMSDIEYPYSVKWNDILNGANNGIGGCSSNYQKAKSNE
jgi:uncharacterized membrane protein